MKDLISRSRLKAELDSWAVVNNHPNCYDIKDTKFIIDTQRAEDIEQYEDLKAENDTLKRLIKGEWVPCDEVQKALEIDFRTGLKMFEFSRIAEWNPAPLNGQKISIFFRLKTEKDAE